MVTIDWDVDHRDGVTLVTAMIADDAAPSRVHVESRLDGPVWPPRRQGEPEAGWHCERSDGVEDGTTFEGVVPAEGHLAIGFASPADPCEPPLEVTGADAVAGPEAGMATPAAVLRGLGDPSPPSLVRANAGAGHSGSSKREPQSVDVPIGDCSVPAGSEQAGEQSVVDETTDVAVVETADGGDSLPPAVAAWLAVVEDRLECAEGLEATVTVDDATAALEVCGGVEGARTLDGQLATDADDLRTFAERATSLAERVESTSVATVALDRLT